MPSACRFRLTAPGVRPISAAITHRDRRGRRCSTRISIQAGTVTTILTGLFG